MREVIQPLLDAGYELLWHGIGRIVLRCTHDTPLGNYVVKLGRHGNTLSSIGLVQNQYELQHTSDHRDECWPLLPVCDWGDIPRWTLMPYGIPLTDDSILKADAHAYRRTIEPALAELDCLDDTEFVLGNFVVWNNRVWLADHGRPPPPE